MEKKITNVYGLQPALVSRSRVALGFGVDTINHIHVPTLK